MKEQGNSYYGIFLKILACLGLTHFGIALVFWAIHVYVIGQNEGFTIDWIMLLFHAVPTFLLFLCFLVVLFLKGRHLKSSVLLLIFCIISAFFLFVIETQNDLYQQSYPLMHDKDTYSIITIGEIHEYTNWWWYIKKIPYEQSEIDKSYLFGYIDHGGGFVIEPKYKEAHSFMDGYAAVQKDKRWGFIDKSGNEVIPFIYDDVGNFCDGLAPVKQGDLWLYIDKQGQPAFDTSYEEAYSFSEGLAAVRVLDQWGYIDRSGSYVISPKFSRAGAFREETAAVQLNNLYGFIDQKGNFVIEPRFSKAQHFSCGMASVEIKKLWGYIDKQGNIVIKAQFDFANPFSEDIARVIMISNKSGYRLQYGFKLINRKGEFLTKKEYIGAGTFSEGLSSVRRNERYGFINKQGKMVIQPCYDMAVCFSEGLALVGMKEKNEK